MSENLWSPEDWAWEQIRSGRIADFNVHFDKLLDPKEPTGWGDDRKLGSGFLRRLFFEPPYRDEIPPEGVRIVGAYMPDRQVLSFVRLHRQVWLGQCRCETGIDFAGTTISGWLILENSFLGNLHGSSSVNLNGAHIEAPTSFKDVVFSGEVILTGAKIDGQLLMIGSTFEHRVHGNGLHVGQGLFMDEGATFKGDVTLTGAKIDGQLSMRGSTFEQKVDADGLRVGQDLFMREAATFKGDVILALAKIGGQLIMRGSTFEQRVDSTGLQVGRHLYMDEAATFKGDVSLLGAKIDGQLSMSGSTFDQRVDGYGLQVGQNLLMREAIFCKPLLLTFSRIGASLDVRGARFAGLNLTGAKIAQELRLAGEGLNVSWQGESGDSSFFNLRNVQLGALQDEPVCWRLNSAANLLQATHQKRTLVHPLLDRAKRVFDRLAASVEDVGALRHAGLHPVQDGLVLETRYRAELAAGALRADRAIVAGQLVGVVDLLQPAQQR